MKEFERLAKCLEAVRKKTDFVPDAALVLGSGLGGFASQVECEAEISYSEIEGFPRSTVEGHKGRFLFGRVNGVKTVVMDGRVHYYEGYPTKDVVLPIRLMRLMGARALMLTNAAGGINPGFHAGDMMLIRDHISVLVPNPLIGENVEELGTRFPDMSSIYDKELSDAVLETAKGLGIELKEGVYIQTTGPSFESPAEIRMAGILGADAVGMSTAVEAIAANHAGMRVCAVSCISNLAAGISPTPLTHAEVQECADKNAPRFTALVKESLKAISSKL